MSAYLGAIKVWDSSSAPAEWVRPSEWLAIPSIEPTEQKVIGLHAVWPTDGNFCTVHCRGAYHVDWGDGETELVADNAIAYHEYSYANPNLNSATVAKFGYKQAIVTITPQSGSNLTLVGFNQKHSQSGLVNGYISGWLDIAIGAPNCTTLNLGGTVVQHRLLRRVLFVSVALGSLASAFNGCSSLSSIDLTPLSGAPITSLSGAFRACASLSSIDLTPLSGAPITTIFDAFRDNPSLSSIDLTPLSGAPITSVSGAFNGCPSLSSVIAPLKISFGVVNCKLSANALNTLYSSLGTGVTGQTLTVTGNYGTATDDPSLVPAGWTVTG